MAAKTGFLFRPQRGGFEDSMKEAVLFANPYVLMAHLNRTHSTRVMLTELVIEPYCFDERNGWDTYSVVMPGLGIVGFTNGPVLHGTP